MEKSTAGSGSTTNLKPNVAGLLCYVGFWVTGIIFLFVERKNRLVRFHAMQSLVTFGILNIIWGVANIVRGSAWVWTAYGGVFGLSYAQWIVGSIIFGIFFAMWWILWGVSMYKAHHGQLYRVPVFGDLAEACLAKLDGREVAEIREEVGYAKVSPEPPPSTVEEGKQAERKAVTSPEGTRAGRIASSIAAIVWSAIFLVFFNFFSDYLAIYSREVIDGVTRWNVYPLLTQDFSLVLPILNTTLILCIAGHIVSIVLDKYLWREITIIVLNALGMATVLTFLREFPLDFSVVPNASLATILPTVAIVILVIITVGLGIGALVRFIKLMVNISKSR